ncbi:rRNA pseudouridine synthase [Rhodobacter sp. NTK016B]|uniref:pseudouridine synthase n=1 Tax=Rhodobacter sp. NTK016B TaxID=2759676 RepID=UPI001A8C28AC|nr:pseudouridine synthase [Rhodobacter sp. NTK016B]MBN8290358.1 rRNA pseudouridine synthase [Rhodobacter sp. NTK016B]
MTKPPHKSQATDRPDTKAPAKPAESRTGDRTGDRIAKVLARSGVASRRAAEAIIAEGRVTVNGERIDSPALNVTPRDKIAVDGKPLGAKEPTRVWLYHKPLGLVTSERDEKGRTTVFDSLPEEMPRVMSVGRLDLNSEGLLLLTNDGELKRRLELPSTGWLRKYRVRVNGTPTEAMLAPLKQGISIDGERFQPMLVTIDRQQGANAWLTIGIREGRNREIRRAMESVGLSVNRLIRVSYGPFQLGNLEQGAVEELRPRVLRDQLGLSADEIPSGRAAPPAPPAGKVAGKPATGKPATGKPGTAKPPRKAADGKPERRSWGSKSHGGARSDEDLETRKPRSWGSKSARGASDTKGGPRVSKDSPMGGTPRPGPKR